MRARKHEIGDIVPVVRALRRNLLSFDSAAFELSADFSAIDPELTEKAVVARRAFELAAARTFSFLETLEQTEAFRAHFKNGRES